MKPIERIWRDETYRENMEVGLELDPPKEYA